MPANWASKFQETLAAFVHPNFKGVPVMTVTVRIVLQPAWARKIAAFPSSFASAVSYTGESLAKVPGLLITSITPVSITVLALGLWRLTTDLGVTSWFPISTGFLSHWQAWIALAIALKFVAATAVSRFGIAHRTREQQ